MAPEPKSRRRRRKKIIRKNDGRLFDATERRHITATELRDYLRDGGLFEARREDGGADCTHEVLQGIVGAGLVENLVPGLGGRIPGLGGLGLLGGLEGLTGGGGLSGLGGLGGAGGLARLARLLDDDDRDRRSDRDRDRDHDRDRDSDRDRRWNEEPVWDDRPRKRRSGERSWPQAEWSDSARPGARRGPPEWADPAHNLGSSDDESPDEG